MTSLGGKMEAPDWLMKVRQFWARLMSLKVCHGLFALVEPRLLRREVGENVVDGLRACEISGEFEMLKSERVTEDRPQQRHRPHRRLSCNVSRSSRF